MAKEKSDKIKLIDNKIEEINKKFGAGTLRRLGEKRVEQIPVISTGIIGLDAALGVGGFPLSRIVEIFGAESSGKTGVALSTIAQAQKKGLNVVFVDAEHCLTGDMLVYLPDDGRNASCEELFNSGKPFKVLSYVNNQFLEQEASIKYVGEKEVYEIRLSSGVKLKLTGNHKVLTQNGYVRVDKLSIGDNMFKPESLPDFKSQITDFDKNAYFLLGFYHANGTSLEKKDSPDISTIDLGVISHFENVLKQFDCELSKSGKYNFRIKSTVKRQLSFNSCDVVSDFNRGFLLKDLCEKYKTDYSTVKRYLFDAGVPSTYNFRRYKKSKTVFDLTPVFKQRVNNNKATQFLKSFPESNVYHKNIRIPKNLSSEQLKNYIAGYFTADGTVVNVDKQRRLSVSFCTSSRLMAKDLESSLLKFGISSNISLSKKEDYDDCYLITVNGRRNLSKFFIEFPVISYKRDLIEKAINSDITFMERFDFKNQTQVLEVKSVNKLLETEHVYDISVRNKEFVNQNFICENVIIHNSLDIAYCDRLGVDVDNLFISQPDTLEDAFNMIEALLEEDSDIGLIVVDSLDALQTKREDESAIGDANVGIKAKVNSQIFRRLAKAVGKSQCCLIIINQVRDKLNTMGYGETSTTTGGRALKFYASIRLDVKKIGLAKDDGEIYGHIIKVIATKNKVAPPYKPYEYEVVYGDSSTTFNEIVKLAIQYGIIIKSGSWFSINDNKFQGEEKLKEYIKSQEGLIGVLEEKVKGFLGLL